MRRVRKLVDWIRENMCPEMPPARHDASARHRPDGTTRGSSSSPSTTTPSATSSSSSTAAIANTDRADERIAIYHGPTPPADREEIKRAFNADPKKHPLRILIATDAAREGSTCRPIAGTCSISTFPGTPAAWSSATAASTASSSRKRRLLPLLLLHAAPGRPHPQSPGQEDRDDQAGTGEPFPGARKPPRRNAQAWHPSPR